MSEPQISDPPRLVKPLEIVPIDTSSVGQKYLARSADGRRFEISQFLFDIVSLIDGVRSIDAIASEISLKEGKEYSRRDVETILARCLAPGGIVAGVDYVPSGKKKPGYLRLKIPLLSQKRIRPLAARLHFFFHPKWMISGSIAGISFLVYFYLIAERPSWEIAAIGITSWLGVYAIYFFATLVHEIGHSSACYHFQAQQGHIGIGLYLYFPVFYTDVSDVWRLKRLERAVVDIAGIYFQLLLLPLIYCLYLVSGNPEYVYAIYLLTLSCITALNPLFRFDGYWLVSDVAGLPNLRKRSGHLLAALLVRHLKASRGSKHEDLRISKGAMRTLLVYSIASNLFFLFFIYKLVSILPEVFGNYPAALVSFMSGLMYAVRTLDFAGLDGQLSRLFFPTVVLIMFVPMTLQVGRVLIGKMNWSVSPRGRKGAAG